MIQHSQFIPIDTLRLNKNFYWLWFQLMMISIFKNELVVIKQS